MKRLSQNNNGSQTLKQISEYRKKVGNKRQSEKTCEILRIKYFERMAR